MNSNGGSKNTKSKRSASKLSIIGNTPEMTKDIKKTISYLENIVINKDTLQDMDTAKLVTEINKLIQYVEVLSIYKKPTFRLIQEYNNVVRQCSGGYLPTQKLKLLELKKQILEELIQVSQLDNVQIEGKDYWSKYE